MNFLIMMLSATDRSESLEEFEKELDCVYQSDVAE